MRLYVLNSSLYTSLFSILAEGRGSELVRERTGMIAEDASSEHCLREQVRSHALRAEAHSMGVSGLLYDDEHRCSLGLLSFLTLRWECFG